MPFIIHWLDDCSGAEKISKIDTPAGTLVLSSRSGVIIGADWQIGGSPVGNADNRLQQKLHHFWLNSDQPIHLNLLKQGTLFRNRVWAELCKIPFGTTVTYSELAVKIDSAARAVGNACRDNPFPLLIPCHRVVSVSGMGGYNGHTDGEYLLIKRKLLAFEAAYKK